MQAKFGPFCFDVQTLELSKFGVSVRLEEKPACFLACLIEHRGEVVSREELRQRLWEDDVFVDFDHGLNKTANKLRTVLGDSASKPKYVETLTRRGYRFIGPVEISSSPASVQDWIVSAAAVTSLPPHSPILEQNSADQPQILAELADEGTTPESTPTIPSADSAGAEHVDRQFPRTFFLGSIKPLALIGFLGVFLAAIAVLEVLNTRAQATKRPAGCSLSFFESSGLNATSEKLPHDPGAQRFYVRGIAKLEQSDAVEARALLDQAIAIEPQHALSHLALSRADSELGFSEAARTEAQKAFDLSSGLSSENKLLFEAQLRETSFAWDQASEVYRSLFTLHPGEPIYGLLLLHAETKAGKPAMAFETLKQLRKSTLPACADAKVALAEAEAAAAISDFHHQWEASARAAAMARKSGQDLMIARAEILEGEAQRALGNFDDAVSEWNDAQTRFAAAGDRSAVARILIDEGRLRREQGDLTGAEQSYDEAISTSKEIGDQANLGRALAGLGQMKMYQVGWLQGRNICEQALVIFRQIGNRQEEAYTLSLIADSMAWQHTKAKPLYERSLELSREVNDRSRIAGRLMDLGQMALTQGDLLTAERQLRESLAIYHAIGERNREALQMCLLAIVLKWEGRLDKAEQLARQAVSVLQSVGETNVRGQAREHLALIQCEAGKLSEAEQTIRLAIEDAREAGDNGYLSLATQYLADILVAEGKVAESKSALDESDKIGNWTTPIGEGLTLKTLTQARIYAAERQFGTALRLARRACAQALSMDQGSVYLKARLVLGEIQLQSGDRTRGKQQLETVAYDASAKGFGLISDQARRALTQQSLARAFRNKETSIVKVKQRRRSPLT